jgi:hypothetical protein
MTKHYMIALCLALACTHSQAADYVLYSTTAPSGGAATGDALVSDVLKGKTFSTAVSNGLTGIAYPSAVPKTGQKTSYQIGSDGYYTNGVAWPNPRFSYMANTSCVLDNLTGLIWARYATQTNDTWSNAVVFCESLDYGGRTDWRLPNRSEMLSIVSLEYSGLALPNTAGTAQFTAGNPFDNVEDGEYWTSTTRKASTSQAWYFTTSDGWIYYAAKTGTRRVWPVCGP